eukprot:1479579-Alexandrium_andersonii.AAC.1
MRRQLGRRRLGLRGDRPRAACLHGSVPGRPGRDGDSHGLRGNLLDLRPDRRPAHVPRGWRP